MRRVQLVDLGHHQLKASIVDVLPDGTLRLVESRLESLATIGPDPAGWFAALPAAVLGLAGLFQRAEPVHLFLDETLIRAGFDRLHAIEAGAIDRAVAHSRERFVRGHGPTQKRFESSLLLDREPTPGGGAGVIHSYARWIDLEQLNATLGRAGLRLGGTVGRLHALVELGRSLPGPGGQEGPGRAALIDAGFSSTAIALFTGPELTAYKVVFAGAIDLLIGLPPQAQISLSQNPERFRQLVSEVAFGAGEPTLTSAQLAGLSPQVVAQSIRGRIVPYFRAIGLALAGLQEGSGGVEAGGEDDELSPLGPPADPRPAGQASSLDHGRPSLVFVGGLALGRGFVDAAHQQLAGDARVLPALEGVEHPQGRLPLPLPLLALSAAAARVISRDETGATDVSHTYVNQLPREVPSILSRGWVRAGSAIVLFLIALFAARFRDEAVTLDRGIATLRSEIAAEIRYGSTIPPVRDTLRKYRLHRTTEAILDTRMRYVESLLVGCVRIGGLLAEVHGLSATRPMAIPELSLQVALPGVAATPQTASPTNKEARFRLSGEALNLDALSDFVRALKGSPYLTQSNLEQDHREVAAQFLHGREHKAHVAFTVTALAKLEAP